ncbi:uncharacterized protein O3C94_015529 [Discoglossus pictus]
MQLEYHYATCCLPYPLNQLCWTEDNQEIFPMCVQMLTFLFMVVSLIVLGMAINFLYKQFIMPNMQHHYVSSVESTSSQSGHSLEMETSLHQLVSLTSRIKKKMKLLEKLIYKYKHKEIHIRVERKLDLEDADCIPCPCAQKPQTEQILGKTKS